MTRKKERGPKRPRAKAEAIVVWHDDGEVFVQRGSEVRPHQATCSDEFLEIAVAVLEEVRSQTRKVAVLKEVPPKGNRRAGRTIVIAAYVVFIVGDAET